MKVLLLIIFSETELYNYMLENQKSYIHSHQHIDVYFVTLNNQLIKDVLVEDDIIYIKGTENYTNILYKTIEALDYLRKTSSNKYDYVVRSNISTIIMLNNLYAFLSNYERHNVYTGGNVETLRWQLQTYEISEEKQMCRNNYYGLKFIQGIGIIMSYDLVESILNMKSIIEYDIVDDVKLGIIIRDYFPNVYMNIDKMLVAKTSYNCYDAEAIFIRNRTQERKMDVHNMRQMILHIKNVDYGYFDKTIYLTHKNIDEKNVGTQWKNLNPEYNIELYDDQRCLDFLDKHYGKKYCDLFRFIKDSPIKADFFRACIIYLKGGIYADADIKPVKPLSHYVDDNIDLMTCISYNYIKTKKTFCYNPQLIVAKKFSSEMFEIMKKYEYLYDNEKDKYHYWNWSICNLFHKIHDFDIQANANNTFYLNDKKYKFIIETILDNETELAYDFSNYFENNNNAMLSQKRRLTVSCKYMGEDVLDNFQNK
jgi:hypothetical protein